MACFCWWRKNLTRNQEIKSQKITVIKKTDINSKTTGKLKSELKTIKTLTGALIGVLIVLFATTIYGLLAIENNTVFIVLIAVGISLIAILPLQYRNIKQIKSELNIREDNNLWLKKSFDYIIYTITVNMTLYYKLEKITVIMFIAFFWLISNHIISNDYLKFFESKIKYPESE